jgi:hypothetical protein
MSIAHLPPPLMWQPPAIVVEWSAEAGTWIATAVVTNDGEPIAVLGPSSARATSPSVALDELLGRRFGFVGEVACAPTIIAIDRDHAEELAA